MRTAQFGRSIITGAITRCLNAQGIKGEARLLKSWEGRHDVEGWSLPSDFQCETVWVRPDRVCVTIPDWTGAFYGREENIIRVAGMIAEG